MATERASYYHSMLKRAVAALEKRQFARALVPLLELWDATRSAPIASFIDRASARFTRPALPAGGNFEVKQARWLKIAGARDPADIPRLLEALPNGSVDDAIARLDVLRALAPDPRIARGLERLLAAAPYGEPFVSQAIALARALANTEKAALDPRELAILEALLDSSGDALLAAVYDDPSDDGRRAVYGDWLLEQNDPRGELINLQLAGSGASELLHELERTLVGPLIWKVSRAPRTFARGFLEGVILAKSTARALAAATAAPEWLTVREIWIETVLPADWFAAPNLRNVRRVHGAKVAMLEHLSPALDVLGLDGDPETFAAFVRDPGPLINVRTLAFEGLAVPFTGFERTPLQLVRLEVVTMLSHIGRWLEAIATSSITELVITNDPQIYCLRSPGGAWAIDIPRVDWNAAVAGNLAAGLAGTDATVTIARCDARYLVHVEKALAPLGSRVSYVR